MEPGKTADRELFDSIVRTPWSDVAEKVLAAKPTPVIATPAPQHGSVARDGEHEVHLDAEVEGDAASVDADTEPVPIGEDPPDARFHTPPRREDESVTTRVRLEADDEGCGDLHANRRSEPQLPSAAPEAAPSSTDNMAQGSKREI